MNEATQTANNMFLLWEALIGLATVIATPILAWLFGGRRRVRVDSFTAFTTAQNAELTRQGQVIEKQTASLLGLTGRVTDLETSLEAKTKALSKEQAAHYETRKRLAAAITELAQTKDVVRRYFLRVRDAWTRNESMPAPDPQDLDWLAKSPATDKGATAPDTNGATDG